MRYGEDQDGYGREEGRGGKDAWLVGVSAEVTDGQYDDHVADVVDVPDEPRQRAGQPEAALDLRDHSRVVGDVDAGDDPEHRDGGREGPNRAERTKADGAPGPEPALGVFRVVGNGTQFLIGYD